MKTYYKITIAKTGIDTRYAGWGCDVTYIVAEDDETAKEYAESEAKSYGCTQHNAKHVLFDEIDPKYDISSIIEL